MKKSDQFVLMGALCLLRASFQQEEKSDRSGIGWWDPDPNWLSDGGLLSPPIGPPLRGGQAAPLEQQARPPAPLVQPPAPLNNNEHVTRGGVHAEDIRCVRSGGVTLLSAVVVPPPEFVAAPVFEDAPVAADCGMRANSGGQQTEDQRRRRTFAMHVQHFARCGVRVQQAPDGKEWLSVTLRFPLVEGIRSAEDEYVMVMCTPQDRARTTQHHMDMRATVEVSSRSLAKKVFRSGPRDVSCRVTLTSRGGGGGEREIKSGAAVRVGQELQIRAHVREGDGWNYAMLKDVVVSRSRHSNGIDVGEGVGAIYRDQRQEEEQDIAQLVTSEGCRNPVFRAVAPFHPQRERPLSVTFSFRAFMFQDMADGDSLRLSAQVVACAEPEDCQQSACGGKRKKRSRSEAASVANFSDNFELTVNVGGFAKTPLSPPGVSAPSSHCQLLVMSVGGAAIVFCLCTTAAAAIAIGGKRKQIITRKH